ncbi:hypothetical protein GCM10010924_60330 [Rhizobium wenxiniae]|uniref:Uncharacterized protein n=1 Tax=Rhizobium wenxiniae TaxID=1737357 RepID=A0A7X0D1W7_9HYPH|nr:hypothetical protein [Rhizobium wenxiniae]MBB6164488.1 hypothetical protein [Rhizobium wenxiniae]GGG22728.1 hypothetical protein GCM10010924_60330 [Rhizobium wenxiniae]
MNETKSEFFISANGDRWFLERDGNATEPTVVHRANPASGGTETRGSVDDFLKVAGHHPQGDALRYALAEPSSLEEGGNPQPVAELENGPIDIPGVCAISPAR